MEDKINYSYIIIASDEDGEAIDLFPDFHEENGDILIENEESEEQFEKRAFQEYKEVKNNIGWDNVFKNQNDDSNGVEYLEFRKYDLIEEDYLDWDMTESKYYDGGSE